MPSQADISINPTSAKGDILTHSSSSRERLALGTNNQILTARSSSSTGLSWETKTGAIGDYVLISSTTVTANATSITISNVPYSAYYHFRILLNVQSIGTNGTGRLSMAINTNPTTAASPVFGQIRNETTTSNAGSRAYESSSWFKIGQYMYSQYAPISVDVILRSPRSDYAKGFSRSVAIGTADTNGAVFTSAFTLTGAGIFNSSTQFIVADENLVGSFGIGTVLNLYGIHKRTRS